MGQRSASSIQGQQQQSKLICQKHHLHQPRVLLLYLRWDQTHLLESAENTFLPVQYAWLCECSNKTDDPALRTRKLCKFAVNVACAQSMSDPSSMAEVLSKFC